jgi:fimbrial chaperone protein
MCTNVTRTSRHSALSVPRGLRAAATGSIYVASVSVAVFAIFLGRLIHAQTRPGTPGSPPAGPVAGPVAGAPQFNITPTRLFIPAKQTSTSLVLRNEGPEALRFQVSAFAWSNDAEGQLVLQPTRDVVFFPVLFGVEPGQTRRVRVAVTERAIERELSYRIFVEQLPSHAAAQGPGVQMLMRASIPVFVQPPTMIARATLEHVATTGGRLSFVVRNIGNVHVSIAQVSVRAARRDPQAPSFDAQLSGWYLLSGEARAYHVTLPPDLCRERPTLTIAVKFADNAQPLTIDQAIADGACAP